MSDTSDRTEAKRAAERYYSSLDRLIARAEECVEELKRAHTVKARTVGALDDLPMFTDAAGDAVDAILNLGRNSPIRQFLEHAAEADIASRLGI